MKCGFGILLFVLCATRIFAQESPIDPDSRLAAITRAKRFMREWERLSDNSNGSTHIRLASPHVFLPKLLDGLPYESDPRIGKTITVNYWKDIEIEVHPLRSLITGFTDKGLNVMLSTLPPLMENATIDEATAISRAERYLVAAGLSPKDWGVRQTFREGQRYSIRAADQTWTILFARLWQGVPYNMNSQWVEIRVDALKGRLLHLTARANAPTPPTLPLFNGAEARGQAITIVRNSLASQSPVHILSPVTVQAQILVSQPGTTKRGTPVYRSSSYFTWQVTLLLSEAQQVPTNDTLPDKQIVAYVDMATGKILQSETNGWKEVPQNTLTIRQLFAEATELKVQSKSGKSFEWKGVIPSPLTLRQFLTEEEKIIKTRLLFAGLMSGASDIQEYKEMPFAPTHTLLLKSASGKVSSLLCDAKTGRVRMQENAQIRGRVGASLRQQLLKAK